MVWSQEKTRLFNQTREISSTKDFTFTLAEWNGTTYFFSIKDVENGNLKLTYGPIDSHTLTPTAYHYINLPISLSKVYLNGVSIVGNTAQLIIQKLESTSTSKLNLVQVDLSSNSLLSHNVESVLLHANFYKAKQSGSKLIMYAITSPTNRIVRIEKDVNSISVLDTLPSVGSNFSIGIKGSEVELVNNEEYACIIKNSSNAVIIKRDQIGNYIDLSKSVGYSTRSWDFGKFEAGKLLFLGSTKTMVFDSNLTLLDSLDGIVPVPLDSYSNFEMHFTNDSLLVAYGDLNQLRVFKFNAQFDSLYTNSIMVDANVNDFYKRGNEMWLIGSTFDELIYMYTNPISDYKVNSLFISRNQNHEDILEYNRILYFDDIKYRVGMNNSLFDNKITNNYSVSLRGNDSLNRGLIYYSSDNLLAKDDENELVGIWSRFSSGNYLFPGPYFSSVVDSNMQRDKYNRSYYVTAEMIASHVGHILTYNNPGYGIPHGILHWPAHGNTANGEAAQIANFIDHNNNGIYEPLLGEFPKIYGDKCYLTMYHQLDQGELSNKLEVHRYLYNFDCDTNEMLRNTVFCHNKFINRGGDLSDVYVGSYIDYDIGYSGDDLIGTNVELGMIYGYNGDSFDESNGSQNGHQEKLAAYGQMVLSGAKLAPDGVDNLEGVHSEESINGLGFGDGIIDNEVYGLESSRNFFNGGSYPYTDAEFMVEFYYNLQGLLQDGTLHDAHPYKYAFFGQSDPYFAASNGVDHGNNLSEFTAGNPPGDRRMMSGSGPGFLANGDTLHYLTAYVLGVGEDDDPINSSLDKLFEKGQKIRSYFNGADMGCGKTFGLSNESLNAKVVKQPEFAIYPNPFTEAVMISHSYAGKVSVTVRNLNGQEVYHAEEIGKYHEMTLDLNAGVYMIELETAKGISVKKLVKR